MSFIMTNNESNVGKWDEWYKELPSAPSSFRYSDTPTYKMAADFLSDCVTVEDWAVGGGGFLNHRPDAIGVDGSNTPFAQKTYIDLCNYISSCEGVNMRHVLEHNINWKDILHNAFKSATKKICITLFIEMTPGETKEISHNLIHGVDVPDLSLSESEFMSIIHSHNPFHYTVESLPTQTGYGREIVYYITL